MRRIALATVCLFASGALLAAAGDLRPASGRVIAGSYIVVLKTDAVRPLGNMSAPEPSVPQLARDLAFLHGARTTHVYEHALKGFAARMTEEQARALAHDDRVLYVERDQRMFAIAIESPTPSWGLDRVSQRDLPLNNIYTFDRTGTGVDAYIIDTGIRASHQEFSGRIGNGFTEINDGRGTSDCNGHGTHVSGTVGGTRFGIAKQVRLHPVRVLDCSGSGTNSGVIAGVNFVTSNHAARAVANMSLGGGVSSALDSAVANSISAGVSYAIAAGNSNANACNSSPARVGTANTVGSTTMTDARSSFSNIGTCVDIFAPGSGITSAWATSDSATNTISGTSMATPHVTGVL